MNLQQTWDLLKTAKISPFLQSPTAEDRAELAEQQKMQEAGTKARMEKTVYPQMKDSPFLRRGKAAANPLLARVRALLGRTGQRQADNKQ